MCLIGGKYDKTLSPFSQIEKEIKEEINIDISKYLIQKTPEPIQTSDY